MIPPKLTKTGWWLVLILIPCLLGLRFLIPRYQALSTIQALEEAGGRVRIRASGPLWLRAMVPRKILKAFQQVFAVELHGNSTGARHLRVSQLSIFGALEELDLSGCRVSEEDLVAIGRMKKLRRLDLSWTAITGDSLAPVQKLEQLESLNLCNTRVDDDGLIHLATLARLQKLNLDSTRVTGAGIRVLKELSQLRELSVSNTDVDPESLEALQKSIPGLTVFDD